MELTVQARKARNEYMKNYRKKNPEKIKNINKRYWEKRAVISQCKN
ncbi:hypothetical protein HMPREF1982_02682 [Clostridiales bacterium oral taxon 876 str. F0540]|nr:hypothetical protein HMPREF1982_02682 [Clostridiales bacterium oral taxon 876 str. F0540]